MNPAVSWFLALSIAPLLLLVLFLVLGFRIHKIETKSSFSLLTMFPFEFLSGPQGKRKATVTAFYFYAALDAFAGAYLLLTLNKHTFLLALAIVLLIVALLKDVAMAAMGLISAYSPKAHLLCFVVYSGLSVLEAAVAAISFANLTSIDNSLALGFCVAMVVLGGLSFLLLINPRLSHWGELRSEMDENGDITTFRPKPFVLAFSEWLLIFISEASTLVALLGFMLLSLN